VFANVDQFAECLSCGRIYWRETHQNRIAALLKSLQPPRREEESND